MRSVKTVSFLLCDLHGDLPSAVLSLEGNSPGGTDCILGKKKKAAQNPQGELHACSLWERPTWDTSEQQQNSQGYFSLRPTPDFGEDMLNHLSKRMLCPLPSVLTQVGGTGTETAVCSRVASPYLSLFTLRGTLSPLRKQKQYICI